MPLRFALPLLALAPANAFAEVMDKEPSIPEVWLWTAIFATVCALLSQEREWLPIVVWPVSAGYALAQLEDLLDPYVGPEILAEAGYGYVIPAYLAVGLNLMFAPGIAAWGLFQRRRLNPPAA